MDTSSRHAFAAAILAAPRLAPFRDPVLKLAVLDALSRAGEIALPALPPPLDPFALDAERLRILLDLEIPAAALARLERLDWMGGGFATIHLVFDQFDGEDDTFHLRDLAGIEALTGLRELAVTPLADVPGEQLDALVARGVHVREWDLAAPPRRDPRPPLVVFRPAELPPALRVDLPAGSGPERCLFWVAPVGSPATAALFQALPEPPIDAVAEAMAMVGRVALLLSRDRGLAEVLRPDEPPGTLGGTYSTGFHSGEAEEVATWLANFGARLVPATELIATMRALEVREADGSPATALRVTADLEGSPYALPAETIAPGLFVVSDRWAPGPFRLEGQGVVTVAELRGWVPVQLG